MSRLTMQQQVMFTSDFYIFDDLKKQADEKCPHFI